MLKLQNFSKKTGKMLSVMHMKYLLVNLWQQVNSITNFDLMAKALAIQIMIKYAFERMKWV